MTGPEFRRMIRSWYRAHGRHDLPWRHTSDPYRIFVSEVMLQQTQVSRVLERYGRFLKRFPTVGSLARASVPAVLREWQGLGYNRRALHMRRAAEIVVEAYGGVFPRDIRLLEKLPGVGPYTARAIAVFAHGERHAFIETNIRRVYLHYFFSGKKDISDIRIMRQIEETLPARNIREWYWALMDHGAAAFKGVKNPNTRSKHYIRQARFEGSSRYVRALLLRALLGGAAMSEKRLQKIVRADESARSREREVRALLLQMEREGFVRRRGDTWRVRNESRTM